MPPPGSTLRPSSYARALTPRACAAQGTRQGVDRHADAMLDFGDYLVLDRGSIHFSSDEKCFIVPSVGATGGSTKITASITGHNNFMS